MGCGSSTASVYQYKDGSPVKPVKVSMSIRRRESFVHANNILVNRVAERLHSEWRITRMVQKDKNKAPGSITEFESFLEVVGEAKVDIAKLSWVELPESVKARKLKLTGVCCDAVINQLRGQNTHSGAETKTKKTHRRQTIILEPDLLDSIAELEYMLMMDNDVNNVSQLPWHALTASERALHHTTTLCVISEWNKMMQEAARDDVATSVTLHSTTDHQNIPLSKSPISDTLSALGTSTISSNSMTSTTQQEDGRVSPLSQSPANGAQHHARLSRTFARGSSRGLTRVLSGRDVLQEIRQTIRVRSAGTTNNESVQHNNTSARQRMKWAALRIAESTRAHLRKQIRKNKYFVRVFVSSTFRDFHAERDYLFQRVFPRLENACAELGILFIPVDLRWGVTTQEALDGEVIKLCLQEVDTCRPFFVAMLGERYGWHVDPFLDKQSSGDTLLKETFDVASMTFPWVKKWRDRSATEIEIRHAVLNNPNQKMHSFFFLRDPKSEIVSNRSTKSEINDIFQAESEHAKKLQDQLKDSIRKIQSKQHRVTDGYASLEELGKTMFEQLKEAIEQETDKKDTMASVVAKALGDTPLDAAHASRTETERLVFLRNAAVAQAFRHAYVKDQGLFGRVEQMCGNASDNTPLVVVGGSGLGKSALLANLSESSAPQLRDTVCVILYIGGQYQSPTVSEVVVDIVHLVRRAVQQLRDSRRKHLRTTSEPSKTTNNSNASSTLRRKASSAVLGPIEHQQPITETDALESPLDLLNKLFEEAGHELRQMRKRLLIGLDGMDRVSDDSIQPMTWLPVATPSGVQLVLSLATEEKSMEQSSDVAALGTRGSATKSPTHKSNLSAISPHVILGRRVTRMLKIISTRKWNIIEVTPMTSNRGQQLVTTYLNLYGKKFDQDQMKLVLNAKHTENPLYMITLLNEIRKFGSFENLGERLELYLKAEDTTSLFSLVLTRLDEEIGHNIVSTAARVIWVARSGVSEFDLKTILSASIPNETYDDFRHRTRDIFVNRANLISFVHFSLADAVEDTYLNENHEITAARQVFVESLELQANSAAVKKSRADSSIASSPKSHSNNVHIEDWNHDHALRGDWWYYIRELAYQYSMLEDWSLLSSIVGNLSNFVLFTEFDPELLIRYWRQLRLQHIRPNTVYKDSFAEYAKEQAEQRSESLEKEKVKEDVVAAEAAMAAVTAVTAVEGKQTFIGEGKTVDDTKKKMRRQSTVPGRRRSLAGIDIQMLLVDPLSQVGKILVHEQHYKMTLEMELDLIDDERDILLKLERFFQMLGEYRIALDHSKAALNLMEKVPRAFFGVVEVSSMLIEMAQLEHKLHEFDNAMEHLENARVTVINFLKEHPMDEDVRRMHIVVLGDMANLLKEKGMYDDAMVKYDEALIWTTQYLGPNDVECAVHLNNLANLLMEEHRYEDALSKYERSLCITKTHYSEDHPEVARTLHNIGLCLKHLGNYGEAMDHFMAAAKMMVDALGTYHPEVGIVLNNMSVLCCLRARSIRSKTEDAKSRQTSLYVQAQQAAERSVVIRERSLGSDHPTLAGAYTNLGKIYLLAENERLSEHCFERAVEIAGRKLGANHPLVGRGYAQLGRIASRSGDLVGAKEKFQRAVRSLRVSMGVVHAFTKGVEQKLRSIESKLSEKQNSVVVPQHGSELNIAVIQEDEQY